MALRGNISAPVQVTDLVEVSKDAASLVVCTQKKSFGWGCRFFVSDVISGGLLLRPPWPTLPGPGRQPLDGSISLKFLLDSRLKSESFFKIIIRKTNGNTKTNTLHC